MSGAGPASSIAAIAAPTRLETIERARRQGLRIIAALPYHVPRALLRAHGFHAMEVWAPPRVPDERGSQHFQAYACSIVVKGAAFLLGGGFDVVDAVLVPHGCDALQGLGSVLQDFVTARPPVLTVYPPRARRDVDADYLAAELRRLGEQLTQISGVCPSQQQWTAALDAEGAADEALADLHRRRDQIAVSDRDFHAAVRLREYLLAEDFTAMTSLLPVGDRPRPGVPVLLSGILADPPDLLDVLNSAGAHVVADDLGTGSRRVLPPSGVTDPWRRMVDQFLRGPADPTRADPIADRVARLRSLVRRSGARGVLIVNPTFCEPEQFYLPAITKALSQDDVPVLSVQHEAVQVTDGQLVNRIEAFVETLS